jgi:hypothetical protein
VQFIVDDDDGKLFQVIHAITPGEIIGGGLLRMLRSGSMLDMPGCPTTKVKMLDALLLHA